MMHVQSTRFGCALSFLTRVFNNFVLGFAVICMCYGLFSVWCHYPRHNNAFWCTQRSEEQPWSCNALSGCSDRLDGCYSLVLSCAVNAVQRQMPVCLGHLSPRAQTACWAPLMMCFAWCLLFLFLTLIVTFFPSPHSRFTSSSAWTDGAVSSGTSIDPYYQHDHNMTITW